MSFRRARIRQSKRALEAMGVVRDAVMVKILSYAHLTVPKMVRPPTGSLCPDRKPETTAVDKPAEAKKKKLPAIKSVYFEGRTYPVNWRDPLYSMSPGERAKALKKKGGSAPLNYPKGPFGWQSTCRRYWPSRSSHPGTRRSRLPPRRPVPRHRPARQG